MPRRMLRTFALIATLTAPTTSPAQAPVMKEPFRFTLAPPEMSASGVERWDATLTPEWRVDSLPPALRLELAPPGRRAGRGETIRAVLRRRDPRGMAPMVMMLGGTFGPEATGSSGALIPVPIGKGDSIDLALTVRERTMNGWWTALATMPNGGRFEIAIDSATRRGEFRSVEEDPEMKVFFGLAELIAPLPAEPKR